MRKLCVATLLAAVLVGCATSYTLVPVKRHTVGGVISVEPGFAWTRVGTLGYRGNIEIWSIDGPGLNTLTFLTGVPDRKPLFIRSQVRQESKEKLPVFESSMNPFDIEELVEATIARNFETTIVDAKNLRPQNFHNAQGFQFDTSMLGRNEVVTYGVFTAIVRKRKLYAVWFQGAKLHYFHRYLAEYNRIVDSLQLVGQAAASSVDR